MTETGSVGARIDAIIADPAAAPLVAAYYDPEGSFAGSDFATLGENRRNQIGIDDLLAITLLDVTIKPLALRHILYRDADSIAEQLSAIPTDVDLWDAPPRHIAAADRLYSHLRAEHGIDWVIAHKLLARKRPRLIPIVDSVTDAALGLSKDGRWGPLADALAEGNRHVELESLRPPGCGAEPLRLLDVAAWMLFSEGTSAKRARDVAESATATSTE